MLVLLVLFLLLIFESELFPGLVTLVPELFDPGLVVVGLVALGLVCVAGFVGRLCVAPPDLLTPPP